MKTLFIIRHAKSDWSDPTASDYERGIKKRGYKDLDTMSSYLSLRQINPDLILSSSALRAQMTADIISKKIGYEGKIHYMKELYTTRPESIVDMLSLQDNEHNDIFLVGHNPELTELVNFLIDETVTKLPTLGIVSINLDIEKWEEIDENKGTVDFFIQPKQFKYYIPKQIRTAWDKSLDYTKSN